MGNASTKHFFKDASDYFEDSIPFKIRQMMHIAAKMKSAKIYIAQAEGRKSFYFRHNLLLLLLSNQKASLLSIF